MLHTLRSYGTVRPERVKAPSASVTAESPWLLTEAPAYGAPYVAMTRPVTVRLTKFEYDQHGTLNLNGTTYGSAWLSESAKGTAKLFNGQYDASKCYEVTITACPDGTIADLSFKEVTC